MMEICKSCYFKGTQTKDTLYCRLWKEMVTWTECSSYMPTYILCDVCGKHVAKFTAYLNDKKEGFICVICEKAVRYNPIYVPFEISDLPESKIHEIYCIRHGIEDDEDMEDTIEEVVNTLSEKEKKTYDTLLTYKGGVLLRSLSSQQKGCLGTLMKKKLGAISNVIVNYRSFKMFKLREDAE